MVRHSAQLEQVQLWFLYEGQEDFLLPGCFLRLIFISYSVYQVVDLISGDRIVFSQLLGELVHTPEQQDSPVQNKALFDFYLA